MPPLLCKEKFIMDFNEKAELFYELFIKQCFFVNNNRNLPSVLTKKRAIHFQKLSFRHMIS